MCLAFKVISRAGPLFAAQLVFASALGAQSGHTDWRSWSFDWEVRDNTGLSLRDVRYRGKYFIRKASVPVIRVKYQRDFSFWSDWGGCGPYQDRIDWDDVVDTDCGGRVCQRELTAGASTWLELGIYARIGAYHLYQVWYLSADGSIDAHLFSKGLSCDMDHDHHPYWRLDIDVDGSDNDQVFAHSFSSSGAPGFVGYATEINDVKRPGVNRTWFVRDRRTLHGVWVLPGPSDGAPDAFSTKDVGLRQYHPVEDEPWPFGADGHLRYDNGESIAEQDVVFWYVGHLHHVAAEGPDHWNVVGPTLVVQGAAGTVTITTPALDTRVEDVAYQYDGRTTTGLYYKDVWLEGTATDAAGRSLTGPSLVWRTNRTDIPGQTEVLGTGTRVRARLYSPTRSTWHDISLTATDGAGRTGTAVRRVFIWGLF